MTALTVTATQGGTTANGLALRVVVLTGAAAVQNGATSSTDNTFHTPFTTTVTGSQVYGASTAVNFTYAAINASTTPIDNITDSTNSMQYLTFKTTSPTGTPGAITGGVGYNQSGPGGCCAAEILPYGSPASITEDASGPAVAWTDAAVSVTSDSFDPPDGSLIVALVSSDGGGSVTSMGLSGGGFVWTPLAEANVSGHDYAGVWIAQLPPDWTGGYDDPVITATQSVSTFNGLSLRVYAITGAAPAASQTGATATQSGAAAHQASITTTVTGSRVYAALTNESASSYTANGSTTLIDNLADGTNAMQYGSARATATGIYTATIGATAPTNTGSCSLLEIVPASGQTLAESGLSPPVATSTTAIAVSTTNFSAPAGSLLVAIVSSDGGTGTVTMTVAGGGLTWSEKVHVSGTGLDYTGIWIADIITLAGASLTSAVPGQMIPGFVPALVTSLPPRGGLLPQLLRPHGTRIRRVPPPTRAVYR